MTILLQGNGLKSGQTNGSQWSHRIVIATGAQRSGGTCCFSAGSHADSEAAAIAAAAAQVGEFVEMLQSGIKRLESCHRQTRHGPVLTPWTLF
jgi:hypothetical protein